MLSCWTGLLAALVLVLGLSGAESNNQILDGPKDATVLVGSEARFNCTVSQGWSLLMWALRGTVVLSITPAGPIVTSERFTSESYQVGDSTTSELIIHPVQLTDAGQVKCSLQNNNEDRAAVLSVQAVGTLSIPKTEQVLRDQPCNVTCQASDWTPLPELSWMLDIPASNWSYTSVLDPNNPNSTSSVLMLVPQDSGAVTCMAHMKGLSENRSVTANLTVVSSLDGESRQALPTWAIALLAVSFSLLLILLVVLAAMCFCSRSRRSKKASRYPREIRKPVDAKSNTTPDVRVRGGSDNHGYSPEEQQAREVVASLPATAMGPRDAEQCSRAQTQQVPGHRQPRPGSRAHVSFVVSSPRTTRNVTLV